MPGFDRTGPTGAGPMTGGARGYCNRAAATGDDALFGRIYTGRRGAGAGRGRPSRFSGGYGFGRGRGRGYGLGQPAAGQRFGLSPDEECNLLKAKEKHFKRTLDVIRTRIAELETEPAG